MTEERPRRKGIALAVPADERKVKNLGDWFYIQPKLNGERCRVLDFHGEPVLLSSYENEFQFLDHIKAEIKRVWKRIGLNLQFDGEIYVHGWERERIDSALRRKTNVSGEVEDLQFHVFDCIAPYPQGERLFHVNQAISFVKQNGILHDVPTFRADHQNWLAISDVFLSQGYEGSILRRWNHPYYEARRTVNQMLKYKPTEEDTYTIVGIEEAISIEGKPKGMIGSFLVQGDDKVVFSVGAGKLDHFTREQFFYDKEQLIGRILVVQHGRILTSGGIPTCAVAVKVL